MLIPHLHFGGRCAEAIALYEKVFDSKARDYDRRGGIIAHAEMTIHGQKVFMNDAFGNKNKSFDCGAVHLILTFAMPEELLACYAQLKEESETEAPFAETPYARLAGNFLDRFGVLWGFITTE